jgi:hypothetical protein
MKGSTFESFLDEAGIKEEVYAEATKRVIAYQIDEQMKAQKISKLKMSKLMKTSRTQLERLLDPKNDSVQLNTIQKAAAVLGRRVKLELVEADAA